MRLSFAGLRSLRDSRFFSKETIKFAILPLFLCNIIFFVLSIFYSPPRAEFVLALALVCLTGLFVNRFVFLFLLFCVMALDAAAFVSRYFQMPLAMLLDSLQFLGELNIAQSITYLVVFAVLTVAFVLTYKVVVSLKKRRDRISLVPFLLVAMIFGGFDYWINTAPQDLMNLQMQFAEKFEPIEDAASLKSGVSHLTDNGGRSDVLIVMVEGLGAFSSQEHQNLIWGPLLKEDIRKKYAVEQGATEYFGSTTSGEARELCNVRADYRDFRERGDTDCLPKRASEAGYRTAAFHAFTEEFFERKDWFPKIGFEELYFRENKAGLATGEPLPLCGVTFKGLCDADVARSVEAFLTEEESRPRFVYWLTLNSHKPVLPGEVPARLSCDDGGVFEDRELCRMSEQWLNVSHLVRDIALNENLKETEILLVGDHQPPLFTRKARNLFQPRQVGWFHLKPLSGGDAETFAAVGSHAK